VNLIALLSRFVLEDARLSGSGRKLDDSAHDLTKARLVGTNMGNAELGERLSGLQAQVDPLPKQQSIGVRCMYTGTHILTS
jgi:hypothetical protein